MQETTRAVYTCDHCGKKLFVKSAMANHENICTKNPINIHPCYSCDHFKVEEGMREEYREMGGNIHSYDVPYKRWMCTKKGIDMHNRRAEQKGLIQRYPETFVDTELMPSLCDLRQHIITHDEFFYNNIK